MDLKEQLKYFENEEKKLSKIIFVCIFVIITSTILQIIIAFSKLL